MGEGERAASGCGPDLTGRVLVFDLDDTLYLERDFAFSGFAALEPLVRERTGRSGFAANCRDFFDRGVRGVIFDGALARMGCQRTGALIRDLVEAYRIHAPRIALAPDAARFLARVPRWECALISDGPAVMQRGKLRALGLQSALGRIVLTGELPAGCAKPHPMAFAHVEEWSRRPAPAHVYIADNAAKDFLEPRRRGWKTIQILRAERVHDGGPPTLAHAAEHVIHSFDELVLAGRETGRAPTV
ncbi:HAD family hydrolase [Novosphingobium profundi]|uniref:HAD family hydrolase n=1 Tax=Novosphingobium profundi TaxID=1774954 RepID=UPI001BDA7F3F|nr:HAD family hydrolase [Novosphingobium profundi]MBT0667214.1 HAD family hydrolase [Novosphingobium profundi]